MTGDVRCESDDSSAEGNIPVIDFTNVDFDSTPEGDELGGSDDGSLLALEEKLAFGKLGQIFECCTNESVQSLGKLLGTGDYVQILQQQEDLKKIAEFSAADGNIRETLIGYALGAMKSASLEDLIKLEIVGIAALNLFLQCNYTGPALEKEILERIYPRALANNLVLAELAVDGYWPCPVCQHPYFLLAARTILLSLSMVREENEDWTVAIRSPDKSRSSSKSSLSSAVIWSARAAVAHERLMQGPESSITLWREVDTSFDLALKKFSSVPSFWLERGLAEHFFDRPGKGRKWFELARDKSGLTMEVTGAVGKRTKFQSKATAQMVVKAQSTTGTTKNATRDPHGSENIKDQMVEHPDDGILLERVKFDEDDDNKIHDLSIVDQSILLAFCLDVKNKNPTNEALTNEEMGAYLARVLDHHDDWMVYSTALLERSWLEFGRSHARERSILQMQALADQHTNRLTLTQSTRESVEESAAVQDRLTNLHMIVYPPRWSMIEDLADRYASLGIVTSAAELYVEIELWDSVVECYKRAGREGAAEKIVRERLAIRETPRMWSALGDLTKDPSCYEKALELSLGRFSDAYVALGEHYFAEGKLEEACDNFQKALKVRPLVPSAWFRLGTMSMQLERWQQALRAFSEVVIQTPDESDAWANIAAIHMHNKQPAEAYPALNESLKYQRTNWRVWVSKLYTCLDLGKLDEAVQACKVLLELRERKGASDGVPLPEERCVKAIVGGSIQECQRSSGNEAAQAAALRTLARVLELLDELRHRCEQGNELWVLESISHIHSFQGSKSSSATRLQNIMSEYQAIVALPQWEKDDEYVRKICAVLNNMVEIHMNSNAAKSELTKVRFMIKGAVKRVEKARQFDQGSSPYLGTLQMIQIQVQEKIDSLP